MWKNINKQMYGKNIVNPFPIANAIIDIFIFPHFFDVSVVTKIHEYGMHL